MDYIDYKELYEATFKYAKQLYDAGSYDNETLEAIFPKLKESEDEKIRQFLIQEVTGTSDEIMSYRNMNKKDVLAWLEKQGEQKPYGQRQECVDCQFNYTGECKGSCAIRRDEQKPWLDEANNDEELCKYNLVNDSVKEFTNIVKDMTTLYAKKNHDYGNAFGEIIKEVGLPYGVCKLKEKLKRIETLINAKAEVNESLEDSLIDLACYTVMTLSYLKCKNNK